MSAKWRRSLAWDEEVFPRWAWPAKALLRTLSSIWLGVSLLVCVVLYGVLASVPIGQLAQIPTWSVYILSVLAAAAVLAVVPTWALTRLIPPGRRGLRFLAWVFGVGLLGAATFWAWHHWAWPLLQYDPIAGKGLRLFGGFSDRYGVITLRRLPGMEMSEVEFYAWWPLRLILQTFVLNMVVATVRRIEFNFKNIGVISVHTGIVLISLGSVYYSGNKLEGNTILFSGMSFDNERGVVKAVAPPPQDKFYDYTRAALYVFGERAPGGRVIANEQRFIQGLPRYNGYGLASIVGTTVMDAAGGGLPWIAAEDRPLSIDLKPPPDPAMDKKVAKALALEGLDQQRIDQLLKNGLAVLDPSQHEEIKGLGTEVLSDLALRAMRRRLSLKIVGYAPYATVYDDFLPGGPSDAGAANVRVVTPEHPGTTLPAVALTAGVPAKRVFDVAPERESSEYSSPVSVEYTLGPAGGMTDERWQDLASPLPAGTLHALVVHVPRQGGETRVVIPATQRRSDIGDTGWAMIATEVRARPELDIVTEGFKGASSSQIKLEILSPKGEVFSRTIFHRFPELTQDFLTTTPGQRPTRRAPDPGIRISYIDADREAAVYIDEPAPGRTRAIVRLRGGAVKVYGDLPGSLVPDVLNGTGLRVTRPGVGLGAVVERPAPVPEPLQNREFIGTHAQAMIAVRVGYEQDDGSEWKKIVWLEFDSYALEDRDQKVKAAGEIAKAAERGVALRSGVKARTVTLPDGRPITLTFGRVFHPLPDLSVTLKEFQMIAYDHRGAPRDYQSLVSIEPKRGGFEPYEHVISLNYPLTAPFFWSDSRGLLANIWGRLSAGLNPRQFKFSQAGWDNGTWQMSQQLVDQKIPLNDGKVLDKPFVGFTVLQVGNSPGIHIIALGAICMGMGIPWAFYVKPWLLRREKLKIQRQLAEGTYVRPGARPASPAPVEASV